MNKISQTLVYGFLCLASYSALAQTTDLKQEVKISAASQKADIKNNQIIFYGPVKVSQGSIKINADELKVFSKGDKGAKTLVATGSPATYSQTLEDGRQATASAKEIRYELAKRTLTLIGQATLKQGGNQVKGSKIQYNLDLQQLVAESSGTDRVITIIQPEAYQDAPKQPVEKQEEQ